MKKLISVLAASLFFIGCAYTNNIQPAQTYDNFYQVQTSEWTSQCEYYNYIDFYNGAVCTGFIVRGEDATIILENRADKVYRIKEVLLKVEGESDFIMLRGVADRDRLYYGAYSEKMYVRMDDRLREFVKRVAEQDLLVRVRITGSSYWSGEYVNEHVTRKFNDQWREVVPYL